MERKEIQVRVDGYTRVCLTVIAVLLTVMIIGLWADAVPSADTAPAATAAMAPGVQRAAILAAQKQTTARIGELIALLKSGDVKVRVTEMPPAGGKDAAGPRKK